MKYKDLLRYIKPKKFSPEQQPKEEVSSWDMALNAAKDSALAALNAGTFLLPDGSLGLVGGTGAEIVGNALQTLGDPNKTLAAKYNPSIASGLTSAGNLAQDVADKAIEYGQSRVNTRDNDTYTGSARNAYDSGFLNVYSGLASMAHADKSASALDKAAQSLTDETPVDPAFSLNYLLSPHGLTRSAANILGSMGAIMPSMVIAPESTTVGVGNAVTRALINRGLYGAAKKFAPRGAEIVRYSMTSPWVEGASEGGFARRDALEQGLSEDEATKRSIYTMGANVPALMASNFAEGLLLGLPFLNSSGSVARKVVEAGIRQQLNSAQQAIEEGTQRGIQNWQAGRDYSFLPWNYAPDQSQEAWEAYFGSLPMGIAPAVSHVASNRNISEEDRKKREAWERGSQDNLSPDAYAKRARYAATMLSENPNYHTNSIYFGNAGKDEGKYWERNPNMNVSTEGMRPESLNALDVLGKYFFDRTGKRLILNAGTNGDHAEGEFGHYKGWKFDVIDQLAGDGALFTADYGKGAFLDEFVKYGQSLGLGMNIEDLGTSNVHLDISAAGKQWADENGNRLEKPQDFGGFNPRGAQQQDSQNNDFDPNFTDKQNEMWQAAQRATARANEKYGMNLQPDWIYRQLAHEAGANFDSDLAEYHNYGGLKGGKKAIGEDNRGHKYFANDDDFFDAYIDEFIGLRHEDLKAAKTIEDYARIMKETDYYEDTYENYLAGMKGIPVPNVGLSTTQASSGQVSGEEPIKPLFDINAEDTTTPKFIEQFLADKATTALSQNDAPTLKFINPLLNGNTFQDTPENRQAVLDRYGDELINYIQSNSQSEQPTQPQTPKTQTSQTEQSVPPKDKNQAIVQEGRRFLEELHQSNDQSKAQVAFQLQDALNKGNFAEVEKILNDNGRTIQQPQPAQPTQPTQPTQSQQQPVTKNKTPKTLLPQPKLTQEYRESVLAASVEFLDNMTRINGNNRATPEQMKTVERLLQFTDKFATNSEAFSDKDITEIAKILKQGGLEIGEPQIDTDSYNKALLDAARQALPLQTRIQQALDKAAQQKKATAISETTNLQAEEGAQQAQDQYQQKQAQQSQEATEQALAGLASNNPTYTGFQEEESEKARQQEEEKQRQAKQEKELEELQARQDEEKRLSEERQQEAQRQETQRQENIRSSQKETVKSVLGISPNDTQSQNSLDLAMADVPSNNISRIQQGNAIAELLQRPQVKYAANAPNINKLIPSLEVGAKNAIIEGQRILNSLEAPIQRENKPTQVIRTPKTPEQIAQEQRQKAQKKAMRRSEIVEKQNAQDNITAQQQNNERQESLSRQLDTALADVTNLPQDNLNQGGAILNLLNQPEFEAENATASAIKGLKAGLARGNQNAIRKAQSILNHSTNDGEESYRRNNTITRAKPQEQVQPKQQEKQPTPNGTTQYDLSRFAAPKSTVEETPNPNEITPQEQYQQIGELLYPEKFSKQKEDVKHSKRGSDVDTRIDNFVEDKDLTPQQKLLKSFGKMLGVKTIFFRNADARFHGAHSGNTTYINVNSEMPLSKVFWHESLHWLKANNPELYKALVKAAGITDAQRQAYIKETGRTDLKTKEEIDEEILADQFEDAAKRTGLFQSIAGKNRGLIQRVIQWLKDTMNKFIDHFRNPDGKLTTKQAQAFADEFGRIANQLKDPNGNKIFRYNRRTHNIELADGRKVEDFSFDEKETRENIAKAEREGTLKYSVGNNNNSNESLWHKAKNAMSSFFGFNTPEKRRRKIITDNLSRLRGYRILYGYVDGADDVVVDNLQKLIKSRNAYDWEKLLPVVGEGIAKNLRLNATQAQSNYIADWLTTGALNNTTSPEAKAFEKAMRDNPAMGEILLETREIFKELANMDAWDSVKSTIAHRQNKNFWEKIKFFGKNFTEQVLDDLQPLQNIVDTAIKQAPPAVAEMIKRGVNVKQLAQIARGRGATADMMINGNADEIAKIRSELAAQYVGCYFDDFKTMKMIIESVDGDWKGLEAFALAKLSKEMYEKNRTLSPKEEPYTPYMSEANADHIINTGEAKFGEAQKDLVRFSKILAAMEYDAGVITDATFARYMKGWKEYIPTPRVWDENEDYNEIDFMKAKRGHTDDTWSPVQTIMANTYKIIQACERNKVKLELATLIRFGGFESNLSEVPTGNPDADNIIRFKENGKTKYLETPDPAIKRAIEAMHDKSEANWLTKTLRATAGFIRAVYTLLNPDFAAGNVFRDLPDAFIHNKQLGDTTSIMGMIQAWRAMFRALPSAFSEARQAFWSGKFSEDFIEWQMNGGAQASFVSEDVDYVQRSIDNATMTTNQRWFGRGVSGFFSAALNGLQNLSELSENVTRLTSYKVAKANLAKAGKTGVTGKQLAALAAREASVDFSKAGRATRTLNKVVIFTNAAVQGINQWVEAFRELGKGNKKPLENKVWRAIVNGVLVAAIQFFAAHFGDDDDKKAYEQAPDWEKETYWLFPAINFRFPKGMDVGIRLFANLTDEALGALFEGKSMNAKRILWDPIYNALPSLTATIVTPAVEVLQNYSYFRGAPIDPKSEQHLPAHMRYDETTSGVAKGLGGSWLAKLFSDGTGWSPRKIDYLINGYLGFMGRFLTHLPNYGERALRFEAPFSFEEFPITRRFTFTPYKNPKIVKEFYEAYDEQEQLYNEYKLTKERPDGYNPALHKRIKATYKQMHEISKRETTLLNTPDMNHDERKAKLQELEKRRVALAERVFQGAR